MARRGDPKVLRLVVASLRCHAQMTQEELGEACGMSQGQISRYESGNVAPSEKALRRIAQVARLDWLLVVHLRQFFTSLLAAAAGGSSPPPARSLSPGIPESVLLAVTPYLIESHTATMALPEPEKARREAAQIWTALERFSIQRRRHLLGLSLRASQSWAFAERVSHESERKAAHNAKEALELAELALEIAERAPEEGWRLRLKGYCWAHLANARRVANDLAGADTAFAQAWHFWEAGADSDPGLLAGWRLYDLEASLRRDQRRFPEALQLLEQARAGCGNDPLASGRILLKKEHVFDEMGNALGSLAALEEAAPLIEGAGDTRLFWVLLFKKANNLVHLERYREAAELLPKVQDLAVELRNELDLVRVVWLRARVAAGLDQTEEAIAALEQVGQDFTVREMPYDAALSWLDLAVVLLKAGRTAEVRELGIRMLKIFQGQRDFAREALAALQFFYDAALQETATVELTRRAIADIEQARRGAPPPATRL